MLTSSLLAALLSVSLSAQPQLASPPLDNATLVWHSPGFPNNIMRVPIRGAEPLAKLSSCLEKLVLSRLAEGMPEPRDRLGHLDFKTGNYRFRIWITKWRYIFDCGVPNFRQYFRSHELTDFVEVSLRESSHFRNPDGRRNESLWNLQKELFDLNARPALVTKDSDPPE